MSDPLRGNRGWVSLRYSSHFPLLIRAEEGTTGPVLELGTGSFSTPVLHWLCAPSRRLVSMESHSFYSKRLLPFASAWHEIVCVTEWDAAPVEQPWSVVLVDHEQDRRKIEIARLAPWADLVVVHDTEGRYEKNYHMRAAMDAYRYRYTLDAVRPSTTILSNTVSDLDALYGWR